jgi:hypothetical protein
MAKVLHDFLPYNRRLAYTDRVDADPYIVYGDFDIQNYTLYLRRDYLPYSYMSTLLGEPTRKTVFIKRQWKLLCDNFIDLGRLSLAADAVGIAYETAKDVMRIPAVWVYYIDMLAKRCFIDLEVESAINKIILRISETCQSHKRYMQMWVLLEKRLNRKPVLFTNAVAKRQDGRHRKARTAVVPVVDEAAAPEPQKVIRVVEG